MPLPANLRRGLYGVGALVALSGVAWLYGKYALGETMSRSLTALSMEVHGGAVMLLLILVGSTVALHAPAGWRDGTNRHSGLLLSAVLLALVVTGFLLYYLGNERARAAASVFHWTAGLVAPLVIAGHAWLGRRARAA